MLCSAFSSDSKEGRGSEQILFGAQKLDKTSQISLGVEDFLAGLRFEDKNKLEELPIDYTK